MGKQGFGEKQENDQRKATQKIIQVLNDQKWHRYKELEAGTGLSTATLSKHLKELEKGIVERHVDAESAEYPPPVCYRLRQENNPAFWNPTNPEILTKRSKYITEYGQLDNYWREFIAETTLNIMWLLQTHFIYRNQSEQSREEFNQALELIYLQNFREHAHKAKEKLKELSDEGVNISKIINESAENIAKDMHYLLKQGKRSLGKSRLSKKSKLN